MAYLGVTDGARLTRSDKIELDSELLKAAQISYDEGDVVAFDWDTQKEAKGTVAKLRTHLNDEGKGLRASAPYETDDGTWAVDFSVTTKRTINRKS